MIDIESIIAGIPSAKPYDDNKRYVISYGPRENPRWRELVHKDIQGAKLTKEEKKELREVKMFVQTPDDPDIIIGYQEAIAQAKKRLGHIRCLDGEPQKDLDFVGHAGDAPVVLDYNSDSAIYLPNIP